MPKIQLQDVTAAELRELSRRLLAIAAACDATADEMDDAKLSTIELGLKTAKARIDQLEGFTKTIERQGQKKMNQIREDQAKYLKSRAKKKRT